MPSRAPFLAALAAVAVGFAGAGYGLGRSSAPSSSAAEHRAAVATARADDLAGALSEEARRRVAAERLSDRQARQVRLATIAVDKADRALDACDRVLGR